MADQTSQKILRIGIMQGTAFIEERLLRARHSVTVGQDAKNTFAILSGTLPESYTVFDWTGGAFHLRITEAMAGKLGVGAKSVDFGKLKSLGLARPHPSGGLTIALSETSRGQVKIGDLTILFQFVDAPPIPSRLQLPKAVRGGIFNTLDWPFAATLLASFAVQVFAVAFVVTQDYPEVLRSEPPERIITVLAQMQPPPVVKPTPASEAPKETPEEAEPQKTVKAPPKVAPQTTVAKRPTTTKTPERIQMEGKVKRETLLGVIGTNGGEGSDFVNNILSDGASVAAMNTAFDGVGLATNGDAKRDKRRDSKAIGATANLGANALMGKGLGRTIAAEKKGAEKRVRGQLKLKHIKEDDIIGGTMSPKAISKVIKRRGRAIRACYEKALGRKNTLAGKVVMRFVVQESGRVSSARVASNSLGDSTVGACLARSIKRMRFPPPEGGSATVEFPFIFTPAN